MAERKFPWFRLYTELISDRKINYIVRITSRNYLEVIGAITVLLALASDSPRRGYLLVGEGVPYGIDDLSAELDLETFITDELLKAMITLGIINFEDGVWYFVNWDKRQPESDNSYDRVKKYRETHKSNGVVTDGNGYSNESVTPTETETETETEEVEEEEVAKTSKIYKLYENNYGLITQKIAEFINDAIDTYPHEWIIKAMDESIKRKAANWSYTEAILKRWKKDGFNSDTRPVRNNGSGQVDDTAERIMKIAARKEAEKKAHDAND